jgi:hypothetical protein
VALGDWLGAALFVASGHLLLGSSALGRLLIPVPIAQLHSGVKGNIGTYPQPVRRAAVHAANSRRPPPEVLEGLKTGN